jgi:hypothetical protein
MTHSKIMLQPKSNFEAGTVGDLDRSKISRNAIKLFHIKYLMFHICSLCVQFTCWSGHRQLSMVRVYLKGAHWTAFIAYVVSVINFRG